MKNDPIGTIPIDAVFSPIKRVNYHVGTARVGQKTDYDKLTMEVWTDGSLLAEDAVAYAAKVLKCQMDKFINFDEGLEPEMETSSGSGSSQAVQRQPLSQCRGTGTFGTQCQLPQECRHLSKFISWFRKPKLKC
jgi:DNA-directed RNA polymerase alpha subunit